LCHDEPRESAKSSKSEQSNAASDNETNVKEEEPLPFMLAPSTGQQQGNEQMLQEDGAPLTQASVISDAQMSSVPFMPQSSNAMTQGLTFGDKNQQCEASAHHLVSYTDERSFWIQRLESWRSKSIPGHA